MASLDITKIYPIQKSFIFTIPNSSCGVSMKFDLLMYKILFNASYFGSYKGSLYSIQHWKPCWQMKLTIYLHQGPPTGRSSTWGPIGHTDRRMISNQGQMLFETSTNQQKDHSLKYYLCLFVKIQCDRFNIYIVNLLPKPETHTIYWLIL